MAFCRLLTCFMIYYVYVLKRTSRRHMCYLCTTLVYANDVMGYLCLLYNEHKPAMVQTLDLIAVFSGHLTIYDLIHTC